MKETSLVGRLFSISLVLREILQSFIHYTSTLQSFAFCSKCTNHFLLPSPNLNSHSLVRRLPQHYFPPSYPIPLIHFLFFWQKAKGSLRSRHSPQIYRPFQTKVGVVASVSWSSGNSISFMSRYMNINIHYRMPSYTPALLSRRR